MKFCEFRETVKKIMCDENLEVCFKCGVDKLSEEVWSILIDNKNVFLQNPMDSEKKHLKITIYLNMLEHDYQKYIVNICYYSSKDDTVFFDKSIELQFTSPVFVSYLADDSSGKLQKNQAIWISNYLPKVLEENKFTHDFIYKKLRILKKIIYGISFEVSINDLFL